MDEADRAQSHIENTVADALRDARLKPGLIAVGNCHWCNESVHAGHLFCDKDCAADYENAQRMKRIAGK